jgi:hypothetical protein
MGRMPTELELDLLYEQEAVGYYYGLRVPFRSSLCGFPAVWEEPPCEAIEKGLKARRLIVRKSGLAVTCEWCDKEFARRARDFVLDLMRHCSAQDANRMPVVSRRLQGAKRSGVLLSSPWCHLSATA